MSYDYSANPLRTPSPLFMPETEHFQETRLTGKKRGAGDYGEESGYVGDTDEAIAKRVRFVVRRRLPSSQQACSSQPQSQIPFSSSSHAADIQPRKRRLIKLENKQNVDSLVDFMGTTTLETREVHHTNECQAVTLAERLSALSIVAHSVLKYQLNIEAEPLTSPCGTPGIDESIHYLLQLCTAYPAVRPHIEGTLGEILGENHNEDQVLNEALHVWLEETAPGLNESPAQCLPEGVADPALDVLNWFAAVADNADNAYYKTLAKRTIALRSMELFWNTDLKRNAVSAWNDYITSAIVTDQWQKCWDNSDNMFCLAETFEEIMECYPELHERLEASSDTQLMELLNATLQPMDNDERTSTTFVFWTHFQRVGNIPHLLRSLSVEQLDNTQGFLVQGNLLDQRVSQWIADARMWGERVLDEDSNRKLTSTFLRWLRELNTHWYTRDGTFFSCEAFRGHITHYPLDWHLIDRLTKFEPWAIELWMHTSHSELPRMERDSLYTMIHTLAARREEPPASMLLIQACQMGILAALNANELDRVLDFLDLCPDLSFPDNVIKQLRAKFPRFIKDCGLPLEESVRLVLRLHERCGVPLNSVPLFVASLCLDREWVAEARNYLRLAEEAACRIDSGSSLYRSYQQKIEELRERIAAMSSPIDF